MNNQELNWGFIGSGKISYTMAENLKKIGKTFSVWNRTAERAETLASEYGGTAVADLDELLSGSDPDIIYISTTHDSHIDFITRALSCGKHVLCEKPITLNSGELARAAALASEKKLILADAMTIWHMPLYKKLYNDYIVQNKLGKVQIIHANWGAYNKRDLNNRFYSLDAGGGALLDLGVYSLSLIRLFMSQTPDKIHGDAVFAPSGADEHENILLENADGQLAGASLSIHSRIPCHAIISCEKGYIQIDRFNRADCATVVDAETQTSQKISAGKREEAFLYEILDMEESVKSGNDKLMKLDLTKDVLDIMTRLRASWNMRFPTEK